MSVPNAGPAAAGRFSRRAVLATGAGSALALALGRLPAEAVATGSAPHSGVPGVDRAQAVATPLDTFDYHGVRLADSPWARQQTDVLAYYLRVPLDDWLIGFRRRAGLPSPGNELGGWYSNDTFNPFGQIVSGLARFHAGTGRADVRDRVLAMVDGFAECIADDGFFYYSDSPNAYHYGYEKMLCGLLDAWLYCGSTPARQAMDRITAWALDPAHLNRGNAYAGNGGPSTEWFTLSENLYRAYLATGDETYRDFAQVWEYRDFWDHFHQNREDFFVRPDGSPQPTYHAYSHVNSLNGLGAGHLVTGDAYYLTALRNAYGILRRGQTFPTGGYGPIERLEIRDWLLTDLREVHTHFETQCGSWAVAKLSKWLLRATGESRYGDWFEQLLYNGVGATTQMAADGSVQYFTDYSVHPGWKANINSWSCCTGTRPQVIADYTDQVLLHGADELDVNLFLPAVASWPTASGTLAVRLVTDFPVSDTVRLVVDEAPAAEVGLRFRLPGWLAGEPRLRLNDAPVTGTRERGWLGLRRTWRAGDELSVRFPMRLRSVRFTTGQTWPAAIAYGPLVLAFEGNPNPADDVDDPATLVSRMRRDAGRLRWTVDGRPDLVARPFYDFGTGERYRMYLDPGASGYRDFVGVWRGGGAGSGRRSTRIQGAWMTWAFGGDRLRIDWLRYDDAGYADVEVDGVPVTTIDQYGPVRAVPDSTELTGLGPGKHVVRITCTGRKRPESRAPWINVGGLRTT